MYIYIERESEREINNDMTFFSFCDPTLCSLCMPLPTIICDAIPCPTSHAMPTRTPLLMASSCNYFSVVPFWHSCIGHRVVGIDTSNNRTRGKDVLPHHRVPPATEL